MPQDLRDQLCRTCLTSLSKNHSILETFDIFTTEDLAKKLMLCAAVAVELSDEYPQQVCSECYKQIMLFYDFQQMCVKSLDKFNELLKTPEKLKEFNINTAEETDLELEELMEAAISGRPVVNKNVKNTATKRKRGRPSKNIAEKNENLRYVTKKDCNSANTTVEVNESPQRNLKNESEVILEVKFVTENLNNNAKKAGILNEELLCSDFVSDNETNTTQKLTHQCDMCNKSFDVLHRLQAHKRQHNGLDVYHCTFEGCERSFIRWQYFNEHVKEHKDADELYKCDVENCERFFINKYTLNRHKRKLHIDRTPYHFVCKEPGCTKRFSNRTKLKIHRTRHAGIKNFIAGGNYLEQELVETAISVHPQVNKDVKKTVSKSKRGRPSKKIAEENENLGYVTKKDCNTANTTVEVNESPQSNLKNESKVTLEVKFATEKNLNNNNAKKAGILNEELIGSDSVSDNETNNTQKLTHQCDMCNKSFDVLHHLQAHKRQHYGLPVYRCPFGGCERSFIRWQYFKEHVKEHKQAHELYKCDVENCERLYKNKSALNLHKRRFHQQGPELKSHMCEICGKVFKSSAVLNDHRFTHIDRTKYPFVCKEPGCTKRFSKKEKLKIHGMRHAGIKNFICPYCGMCKTTRNELKIHINYHTLERTWPCRFCSKVCNNAGNLKIHVKNMHERAKDFGCQFCDRTFAKADTKKYHEMTHTGEKPHQCKECGKRFVQPAALRAHAKVHLRKKARSSKDDCAETNDHKAEQHSKERETSVETEALVSAILSDDC